MILIATYLLFFAGESMKGCYFAAPQNLILDTKSVGNTSYYLVKTITGHHDKVEFLYLFDEEPIYDDCKNPHIESVDSVVINDWGIDDQRVEPEGFITHVYLDVENEKLEVIYEDIPYEEGHDEKLKLEIK